MKKILINHLGYEQNGFKHAVVQSDEPFMITEFSAVNEETGETVFEGKPEEQCTVDRWGDHFTELVFTDFSDPGLYRLQAESEEEIVISKKFRIETHRLVSDTVSDIIYYFKGQRHTGEIAEAEKKASFAGDRKGTADVHGGWADATGDWGSNLSHLNHANFMNPQQAPLPVWCMLECVGYLQRSDWEGSKWMIPRLRDEAAWGADKLVRMLDEAGYFYEMVSYSREKGTSEIRNNPFASDKIDPAAYQAGFRQGGGMAVAALARAAAEKISCDFSSSEYLEAAVKGFRHLEEHNAEYLDDGRENIIDTYCALMAVCELFNATDSSEYLELAESYAERLIGYISENSSYRHWFSADEGEKRPFFHASDEGLPVVALLRYMKLESDERIRDKISSAVAKVQDEKQRINSEVDNPFRYARQLIRRPAVETFETQFFMPHENETEYWWQGENARLGSIAAADLMTALLVNGCDAPGLKASARAQLDWILGLNPFDSCMLHGRGRNNHEYVRTIPNAPGGVYNGITSDPDDEHGIAFMSGPHAEDGKYTWRWAEQWIPHAAWLLLAIVLADEAQKIDSRE